MRATDVMVRGVVTVHPETDVAEAVKLLAEHDVSALPVVDDEGKLLGILSEADLMHRRDRNRKAPAVVAGGGDRCRHPGRGVC
jgi:CBS domain-containing protein